MAVPPLVALKAAGTAQKALTGDMFTRTTSKVVGKGKKARVVEDTFHINPVTAGIGLAATAVGVGLAAWILQLKLAPQRVNTYKTVVDVPEVPEQKQWVTVNDEWVEPVEVQGAFLGVRCNLDGAENTLADPAENSRNWYGYHTPHGLTNIYGTRTLAGYWKTHKELQVTAAAIPAVTHQEVTSTTKKFSIEQRRGFSMTETLEGMPVVGAAMKAAEFWGGMYEAFTHPFGWGKK